jgi:hypothetical protein
MTTGNTLTATIILGWLGVTFVSADSYTPAIIENSLRQFPAGSLDRSPAGGSPLSETLRMDTTDSITVDFTPKIEFESFVPKTGQFGTFKPAPLKFELQQIATLDPTKHSFEFVIKLGGSTYTSFAELKAAIAKLPKGTEITWAPGCIRMGGEPLDTHWKEFSALCEKQGIILVVIPSG